MDNASKALIIAGAILISVMLVSLGVMLYNTAAGTAESSLGSISALGISSYNAQFENSFGKNKSKSQASQLVSKIIANNGNPDNPDIRAVSGDSVTPADAHAAKDHLTTLKASIDKESNTKKYTISGIYGTDGTLETVKIVKQ